MNRTINIAVFNAIDLSGQTFLSVLEKSDLQLEALYPLAEQIKNDTYISFKGVELDVLSAFTFNYVDANFLVVPKGSIVHQEIIHLAREANCPVLNGSSGPHGSFLLAEADEKYWIKLVESGEIFIPSSSATLMLPILKPLHQIVGINSVHVVVNISSSNNGTQGIEELREQTIDLLNGRPVKKQLFHHRTAFNIFPQVGELQANGSTSEEIRIAEELMSGLDQQNLRVNVTCTSVPVFFCDSIAVHLHFDRSFDVASIQDLISDVDGVDIAKSGEIPTIETVVGSDKIVVCRIRQHPELANQISFWLIADSMRCSAMRMLTVINRLSNLEKS